MKTERIRNATQKSRITSLDPPQWKLRVTPLQWKMTLPRELGGTVEMRNKFVLDPHGGNMYKQNQQGQGDIKCKNVMSVAEKVFVSMNAGKSMEIHTSHMLSIRHVRTVMELDKWRVTND
mgnify:CR=1 FL=1